MRRALRWLWQAPQHLLALLLLLLLGRRRASVERLAPGLSLYRFDGIGWGVSLGRYIILDSRYDGRTAHHEWGHSRQSLMLGPLYLLVVGLPSISMNILSVLLFKLGRPRFAENYYNRWPESWADRLGGVERS